MAVAGAYSLLPGLVTGEDITYLRDDLIYIYLETSKFVPTYLGTPSC